MVSGGVCHPAILRIATHQSFRRFDAPTPPRPGRGRLFMTLTFGFSGLTSIRSASGISMRQSSPKFGQLSQVHGQLSKPSCFGPLSGDARDRLCVFLRARHPHKTAEGVEAATRGAVHAAAARKWLDRSSSPGFAAFLELIRAYGAELLVFVIGDAPESLLEAAIAEKRARFQRRLSALEAEFDL
jgi:hypothetical protein